MFVLSLGPSAVRRFSRSKSSFRFWMLLLLLLFVSSLWRDGRASARADASAVSPIIAVSAASFQQGRAVAPGSLVAAFTGGVLPAQTFLQATDAIPSTPAFDLPTLLGNFSAEVHGRSAGIFALIYTPGYDQFNILIPPDLPPGKGPIVIKNSSGQILAAGEIEVAPVTPAIFTANSAGSGVPAALVYRYRKGVFVGVENVFQVSTESGQLIPRPIDLGGPDDDVFLILFLTGISRLSNPNDTRLLIGGEELIPLSASPQGYYTGLDQVNVLLSRSLRGRLTLAFAAIGYGTSNLCEIEVAPPSNAPPSVFGLSKAEALAGELVEVTGTGFSSDSEVLISDSNRKLFNAKIMEVKPTSLKVLVPYGAGTGNLVVRNLRGEASFPFRMRTSMSGIVQTAQRQQDGSERRVGVRNVTIRLRNSNLPPVQTSTDGSFLMPDVPPTTPLSSGLVFEVDGTTNGVLPLAKEVRRIRAVSAGRDNPFPEYIELKPESNQTVPTIAPGVLGHGAFAFAAQASPAESELTGQTGQVVFEPNGSTVQFPGGQLVNPLKLTVLDTGRTPADLPFGQYSSTIVQLSPFGAQILPGGKLTFPNTDGLAAGKQVNLFRFDQTAGSNTIGQFVTDGTARVSADGLRIETASNAVKESTYYFVSDVWPTTTIYGKVAEEDDTPARGALVQVRGQSIFSLTDQNGSFYLVNVPIVGTTTFTIEVSFLRPDGTVDRTERSGVSAGAGGLTYVSPPIKLPGQGRTRAPVILAPKNLSIEAGKTSDFSFLAYARVVGQTLQPVSVSGASFASILSLGNDRYTLRLAPASGAAGVYSLVLTATDGQPLTTMETIDLEVKAAGNTAPIANSQSAVTNEDTPLNLTLTGSGGTAFRLVNSPLHGKLEGTAPSLVYRPNQDFNGSDSFSFALGNGSVESAPAVVSIAVKPVDDRPLLEVGNSFSTNIGQPLNFVITGRDGDAGQTLTLMTTGLPAGASVTQTTATSWLFDWTPNSTQIGSFSLGLLLKDDGTPSQSDTKTVAIAVDAKWARSPGLDGGLIQCFVVIGNTIFAGTDLGGIFRSTDNGASWAPSGLSNQDVQALVASGTTIFAATNKGVFRSTDNGSGWSEVTNGLPRNPAGAVRSVFSLVVSGNAILAGTAGGGTYRTTDSGAIWTDSSAGLPKLPDMSFRSVFSLLTSGNNVFAGTSGGIYRSTDGGANWSAANSGIPTTTDGLYRSVVALVGTPGGTIFAGILGDGVFRSTNSGASWTPVNNGLTDAFVRSLVLTGGSLYAGTSGNGVFVSGDSGATWTQRGLPDQIVYALAAGGGTIFAGTYSSIFRTADGGINWTRINNGLSNLFAYANVVVGNSIFTGTDDGVYRSTDNGASWVRTGLQGTVVIGLSLGGNTIFAAASGGLVYRSLDGGASWFDISNALDFLGLNDLIVVGNAFLAATDEGIYRSIDNGTTWNQFGTGLPTYTNGAFRPVYALLAKGNTLFAGTRDAGIYRSTDSGATWTQTSNGLPKDSEGLFRGVAELLSPGNAILAGTLAGGLYRSIDNGINWTAVTNGFDATSVQTLAVAGNVIYAGTNNKGVFRSNDDGASWSPSGLSGLLWVYSLGTSGGSIFAATTEGTFVLAESALAWSESNAGLANKFINAATLGSFLVGTYNGGVFRSADDAQNWQPSNNGLPPAADVRAFIKTATGTFAGIAGAGVYVSSDQGQNWSARTNGLSNLQVNALATDGTTLWAGTDDGVFRSTDSGQNWLQINNGLTRLHVLSLSASGAGVFAGTDNGLFRFNSASTNWSTANSGLTDLYVLSLGVAPNGTALLAGTANGLFRSTNQGQNWAKVASGISEKVVAFVFLQGGTKLLAGTVNGIYLSDDNGASWIVYNTGLLNPQVSALAVKDKLVVAGTRGSGVFVSQIPDVLTNHPPTVSLSCPNAQTVSIGTPINCTITASDPETSQLLSLTAGSLPGGATFNPGTGVFAWTPSAAQTGVQIINFTATDNGSPRLASSRELTITVNNPVPVLSNLSPSSTGAGGVAFNLNVIGSGFVANSIVRWNGNGRTTSYTSPTQLSATIPATDIASLGTAAVSVFNPTPGGGSSNSLTFTIGSPCSFGITPPGQQFTAAGGTGTVNVTATSGCAWTAVSNATAFLTVTGGASGTGNGTVSYSVAANTSAATRQGTLTIAGQTFTVMQAGQPQTTELAVDDGTFETNVGLNLGGIYGFVNRLSPSSYPATLTGISIFIPTAIPVDKRFNLIWGSITASDSDINVVSFQEVEVRTLASGQFNVFTLTTPFTITSGDFVVGCRFEHDQGQFPAALDRTASKGRSFQSINRGTWGLIDNAAIGAGNWGIRARITGQQAGINELALDDGTFEQTLGETGGGYTRVLNRFTPTSYPIVAKGVSIFFPAALNAGRPVILLIGKIASGDTNVNSVVLQQVNVTVQTPGQFNVYTIPDLSVTSGDLLLGFRIDHSATEYPVANDRTLPHRGRSYYSGNGGAFQLIDNFAGLEGNFGVRARVLAGSGLQEIVE